QEASNACATVAARRRRRHRQVRRIRPRRVARRKRTSGEPSVGMLFVSGSRSRQKATGFGNPMEAVGQCGYERKTTMRLALMMGYSGATISFDIGMAQEAEALGFHSVWTAEAYGSDAVSPLAW